MLRSPGQPLDSATRAFFDSRFGHDFSRVRVHTGPLAAESAKDTRALAYTVGQDVVFGANRFAPQTLAGKKLLAHELAHTIQQAGLTPRPADKLEIGETGGASEREADLAAEQVVHGLHAETPHPVPATGRLQHARLQRGTDPYASSSIPELQRRAKVDPGAAKALEDRFRAMSDAQLARWAKSDPMAQSIYEQRTIAPKAAAGQGKFSEPSMHASLQKAIADERVRLERQGITRRSPSAVTPDVKAEGGTIAAARTDIPGLEDRVFVGRSPKAGGAVNPESPFAPRTDPSLLPHTHGHAEQDIGDQLDAALRDVPKEKLKGRRVWVLVEQDPCPTCVQEGGVLSKIKSRFPELTFEVKSLTSSALFRPKAAAGGGAGPALVPGLPEKPQPGGMNPPPKQMPAPKLENDLPKLSPKLPELGETPGAAKGAPRRPLGGGLGRAGRIGTVALGGAANIALELALVAAQIIIEFIILPKLEEWRRELEEGRRKRIQARIQTLFEDLVSAQIGRQLKACHLKRLRDMEKAGKPAYVHVDLMISLEDTSNRFQLFGETPPETFFDIEVDDVRLSRVAVSDKPIETTTGPLQRCESCGTFGRSRTFMSNNPLWEQKLTFSFEAPSADTISKEFESTPENEDCCFIATACYGSLLAPEVAVLRRFRDRKLLTNAAGRLFVRAYYRVSPGFAAWLTTHERARALVRRGFIAPIVRVVRVLQWDEIEAAPPVGRHSSSADFRISRVKSRRG